MNDCNSSPAINQLVEERRKSAFGGHGFILGAPGSGRHAIAQSQILSILRNSEDEVIVLDTLGQYRHLNTESGCQPISVSYGSGVHINPFDLDLSAGDEDDLINLKIDFMIALCGLVVGPHYGLSPGQVKIIERCVRGVYEPLLLSKDEETGEYDYSRIPTMRDFFYKLRKEVGFDAKLLADAMEVYAVGSLDLFSHPTNVEHAHRFVIYDFNELGINLTPMGVLVALDHIWNRYVQATISQRETNNVWIFMDDVYPLFESHDSISYLRKLFGRGRVNGCIFTGVTMYIHNVMDAAENQFPLLFRWSYLHLLNLPPYERKEMGHLFDLTEDQLSAVTDAPFGQSLVYIDNRIMEFSRFLQVVREYRPNPKNGSWVEVVGVNTGV